MDTLHLLDEGQTHSDDHAFYFFLQIQQLAHSYLPIYTDIH
jgi:hypothetical protein